MRRYGLIILFFIVLITPFVLRRAIGEARPREMSNAMHLTVLTPNVEGIRREIADAFSRWHEQKFGQPVQIDYRNYGGGNEILRFFRSSKSLYDSIGTYNIDIVWGGGDFLFDQQLKPLGVLQPVRLSDDVMRHTYPSATLNGSKLHDGGEQPAWFGVVLSAFGILYNRDVVNHLQASEPKQWSDLADARFAGWFVAADPTHSASANKTFMIIIERAMIQAMRNGRSEDDGWADGMGMVRLICSNARYFTDAGGSVPNVVSSGDAAAGMAIDFFGRSQVAAVGETRLRYLEPEGATAIAADPVALVKGAQNRELAIRFIEFLLSDEGQRLWIIEAGAPGGPAHNSLRRLPVSQSIYNDRAHFTIDVDPFGTRFAFDSSPARQATFNIVAELIESSCMSLLEELRETRRAIEQSPRRDELRARLAKFPFDQKEALRRQAAFRSAPPVAQLRMKAEWREEFRREYEQLRNEARD